MKKMRIYLLLVIVLAAVAVYFFLGRRTGTYAPSEHEFAVRDTHKLVSVTIGQAGNELILRKVKGQWRVNGSPARKEAIRGLYVLVSRLEAGPPVSKSMETRIMQGLEETSGGETGESRRVRIGLEGGREKSYRVFYDSLSGSTYMKLEGAGQAFKVRIRGYRYNNLAELFPADPRHWRDNLLYRCMPSEIQSVSLLNRIRPEASFHLARDAAGNFEIARGEVPRKWVPAQEESLVQYLGYFEDVRFDSYLDPESDTLHHVQDPDYTLVIMLGSGEKIKLELYPVFFTDEKGQKKTDLNHLYAHLGGEDEWVVIKYVQIDPLLQDFEYFEGF